MKLDFKLAEAYRGTRVELDGVISALGGTYPPIPPPPPPTKTYITYLNGTTEEFSISGETGNNSFPNKINITKADIGNTISVIGDNTFDGCENLTSITLPSTIISIGYHAFYYCIALPGEFQIPENVEIIDSHAFSDCKSITSVTIGDNCSKIYDGAFLNCSNLKEITIGSGITYIDDDVFCKCIALSCISCNAVTAPTLYGNDTFGSVRDSYYTGRNTYDTGHNVLKIPQGATGYNSGQWLDPLQNSSKCGFHIEYI